MQWLRIWKGGLTLLPLFSIFFFCFFQRFVTICLHALPRSLESRLCVCYFNSIISDFLSRNFFKSSIFNPLGLTFWNVSCGLGPPPPGFWPLRLLRGWCMTFDGLILRIFLRCYLLTSSKFEDFRNNNAFLLKKSRKLKRLSIIFIFAPTEMCITSKTSSEK